MKQMTTPHINKDLVQCVCSDYSDNAEECGPLKLLGAREDGGGDIGA
jgi:hypothetical protein